MPADIKSVNLLESDSMQDSPIGRIVNWAITFGRYIMITTEIVVLLAFVSRFSLDRKLTDLNEAIAQKQVIIEANRDFETYFITLQTKITHIKNLLQTQSQTYENLVLIKSSTPPDVYLEKLDINQNTISGSAIAYSTNGFAAFIYKLKSSNKFSEINLGEIKKDPLKGLMFTFGTSDKKPETKARQTSPETEADNGI